MSSHRLAWVGIVLALVFVAGTTAPVTADPARRLTSSQLKAIRHAPHPYIRRNCDRGVDVWRLRRTSIGTRRVVVAQVECRGSTTGAPIETAVYGRRDHELRQLYRLDSGRAVQRGRYSIASGETFRVHGSRLVLPYWGYRAADPLCCPSRTYHRVFHLARTSFRRGKLVRDS